MTQEGMKTSVGLLRTGGAANPARVHEILEVRRMIEPHIAALAAGNATKRDVARLRHIIAEQEEAAARGVSDPSADAHYHLCLARMTGNEVLREVAAVLHDILAVSRDEKLQSPERIAASIKAHRSITDAVEERDPVTARERMLEHLGIIENELFPPIP
jgi:GntR family transcriptional repressor for pyruvate dehydrogenase complex